MNRAYAKRKKRTKKHERRWKILDKEYEKRGNKKQDAKNKFVSKIGKDNDVIAVQDEHIADERQQKLSQTVIRELS
ncbi:MAG: hypothetical protein LBO67_07455 [Spirochaetaceae bacterium]|nr:hypothetical protein [Spirochaetaceae bacterium]